MGPILPEAASPRRRRQAFIATCSPDELLGQVIQALCPKYHIDAPHLFALRKVVSSAIVAPRAPPQLKRTRPDKRIGEIGSIYETPSRSSYGINGPPVSTNQSFYFHHQDSDFEKLLPQVDRSRYVWPNEPVSQEDSVDQEIPDRQKSMQSERFAASPSATKRNVRYRTETSSATKPTDRKETLAESSQQPNVTRRTTTLGHVPASDSTSKLHSVAKAPKQDFLTNLASPRAAPLPTITITSPDSKRSGVLNPPDDLSTPFPSLHAADIAIDLPDIQDAQTIPRPFIVSAPCCPQASDSQSTFASTQNSEVFSPPNDFVNFTPPTQEDSQYMVMSQAELSGGSVSTTTEKTDVKNEQTYRRRSCTPARPSPARASPPETTLGKRTRNMPAHDNDPRTSLRKRTKSV